MCKNRSVDISYDDLIKMKNGVYTERALSNTEYFYIKDKTDVFKVMWDNMSNVWRVLNPKKR